MSPSFSEHLASARRDPAYWSYLSSLEFVDRVVAEMDTQGVTGAELARRIGTSRAYVSKVLAGEGNLTIGTMGKLAFALGMKVATDLEPITPEAAAAAVTES